MFKINIFFFLYKIFTLSALILNYYIGEVKYRIPTTEFEEAMTNTGIFSNKKAQTILGWNQRHLGFIDGINIWWNSYKAYTQ